MEKELFKQSFTLNEWRQHKQFDKYKTQIIPTKKGVRIRVKEVPQRQEQST